jgi:glycerol kinase
MTEESGIDLKILKVDGGATNNRFLMQFQADILNKEIERPQVYETTALGAAYLAGLAVGFWESFDEIVKINTINSKYTPSMSEKKSKNYYQNWKRALEKSKAWVEDK